MSPHIDPSSDPLIRPTSPRRVPVVDLLRGLAIVLMALDHVREFLQAEQVNPLTVAETTPALFFTRWITHFCPSLFILLAGAAIALGLDGRRSRARQSQFLLVRGGWLIVLELTAVHLGWQFNFHFLSALGQVIWVIGWSMICMAGLIWLPVWLVTAIGLALILGHNAFDSVSPEAFGSFDWLWRFLHAGGGISGEPVKDWPFYIHIAYPLIPWVGVMAAGFGFGRLLRWDSPARVRVISAIGLLLIALFVVLRGGNFYGDPSPWTPQVALAADKVTITATDDGAATPQADPVRTLLAILNCQKYPPSLAYLLMTLGPVLAAWPLWERWHGKLAHFLVVFGRVPLFFYVLHLFVIHALAMVIVYAQIGAIPDWLWAFPPGHAGPGSGVDLPALYVVWAGVVAFHYPICRWYGALKSRHPHSLLRFL